jgi:hypothetical protein
LRGLVQKRRCNLSCRSLERLGVWIDRAAAAATGGGGRAFDGGRWCGGFDDIRRRILGGWRRLTATRTRQAASRPFVGRGLRILYWRFAVTGA